jgi:hypothetical protein
LLADIGLSPSNKFYGLPVIRPAFLKHVSELIKLSLTLHAIINKMLA